MLGPHERKKAQWKLPEAVVKTAKRGALEKVVHAFFYQERQKVWLQQQQTPWKVKWPMIVPLEPRKDRWMLLKAFVGTATRPAKMKGEIQPQRNSRYCWVNGIDEPHGLLEVLATSVSSPPPSVVGPRPPVFSFPLPDFLRHSRSCPLPVLA